MGSGRRQVEVQVHRNRGCSTKGANASALQLKRELSQVNIDPVILAARFASFLLRSFHLQPGSFQPTYPPIPLLPHPLTTTTEAYLPFFTSFLSLPSCFLFPTYTGWLVFLFFFFFLSIPYLSLSYSQVQVLTSSLLNSQAPR